MTVATLGEWIGALSWLRLDLFVRLLIATVLGGLIGLEREISDKPAGFRTNILICVGSALLTDLSVLIAVAANTTETSADPTRIAAQIVSGIGFLGAGTIIQARGSVRGLTTAATLWVVAAIGMTVGAGAYVEAIGTTILVICVLVVLGRIERSLLHRRFVQTLTVVVDPQPGAIERVENALIEAGFDLETLEIEKRHDASTVSLRAAGPRDRWRRILRDLGELPGVRRVTPQ